MRAVLLNPNDDVAYLVEVPQTGCTAGVIDGTIDFRMLGRDWGMFFDDEFIRKELPLNLLATVLYRQAGYGGGYWIGGPALVVGIDRWGGNLDIQQGVLAYMADTLGWTIVQKGS